MYLRFTPQALAEVKKLLNPHVRLNPSVLGQSTHQTVVAAHLVSQASQAAELRHQIHCLREASSHILRLAFADEKRLVVVVDLNVVPLKIIIILNPQFYYK
jgi:hypothetical protein